MKIKSFLIAFLVLLVSACMLKAQNDWAGEYARLKSVIDDNYNKPPNTESNFEVWLQWIETKAQHRNQVAAVLNQINTLYNQDPDNKEYNEWTQKFFELLTRANESGRNTVEGAAMKFIRMKDCEGWEYAYRTVNNWGRRLYMKAKACDFDTHLTRERSRCLINYSIGDLESSCMGGGLYGDRDLRFGYFDEEGNMNLPDRNFNVECERRGEFERFSEGHPQMTIDWSITAINLLRDECEWWEFMAEKQDATDLLNEYYKDALCKVPPHKYKMGHKYFLDLAEETEGMEPSVEYNEGFYGTLYGKVELKEDEQLNPAPGAKVTVNDYDQTWTTSADAQGKYEIKNVILHKDCSPFDISAEYEGDWVYDTYEGPLEKPDKSCRHEKNLVIIPKREYEWSGVITINSLVQLDCEKEIDDATEKNGKSSGTIRKTRKIKLDEYLNFRAKDKGQGTSMIQFIMNDMEVEGNIMANYFDLYEKTSSSKYSESYEIEKTEGHHIFKASNKYLTLQIVKQNLTNEQNIQDIQNIATQAAQGGYDEEAIEAMNKKLDKMMNDDQNSTVKIIVQYSCLQSGQITFYQHREHTSKANGKVVDTDSETTKEGPLVFPLAIEMDGNLTKNKDGSIQVTGQFFKPDDIEEGEGCPPIKKYLRCTLNMTRKRIK